MTISITCPNGHKLKARDSDAGRSLPCPACGATVVVPQAQAGTGPESPADVNLTATGGAASPLSDDELSDARARSLPQGPGSRPIKPASTSAQGAGRLKLYLLIGGVAGGSILGLLLLLVAWLVFSSLRALR